LVNNAGMNITKPALDIQPDEYQTIISTNMNAPFFLATELARRHIAAKTAARIINISSVGGTRVLPGITPYCMSKSGILMMTRGLAREWARHDINVNAICPGYIETEINDFWWQTDGGQKQINSFPRRRLAGQQDLDGALLLLAGPQGSGMTGTSITVDDGQFI
jgi:NAD(P)-dependent dehydrogenase (short-subunit alcohol dehydrogenase family)